MILSVLRILLRCYVDELMHQLKSPKHFAVKCSSLHNGHSLIEMNNAADHYSFLKFLFWTGGALVNLKLCFSFSFKFLL